MKKFYKPKQSNIDKLNVYLSKVREIENTKEKRSI